MDTKLKGKIHGSVTLTLSLQTRFMNSSHRLSERNIWMNFIVNHSKGSGDIERTQNCWVDPMTLKCGLDIE